MKTGHKVFIIIGLFFIAVCVFLAPRYYAVSKARDAMSSGQSAMMNGNFAMGAAQVRYAMEQYRLANGKVDAATSNSVRASVAEAAASKPLESLPGLLLLHDYAIGLTCEQKQAVAVNLLRMAGGPLKRGSAAGAGEPLYVASMWLQGCAFDGRKLAQYNSMLDSYAELLGGLVDEESWLASARAGQVVDGAYAVPLLKQDELAKLDNVDIKTRAAEFAGGLQHSVTRLVAAGSSIETPKMPGAKAGAAKDKKNEKPAAPEKGAVQDKGGEAPAQVEKPAAAAPAAEKPAPVVEKKPAEKPAPAVQEKPAVATKPAAADGKQGKLVSAMPPARNMSPEQAAEAIRKTLAGQGVTVTTVAMPGNGKVVVARIKTNNVKGALLEEVTKVLSASYTYAGSGETGQAADKVAIHVESPGGDKRYTFGVQMASYAQYSSGAMDKNTFLKKHVVVE